MHAVRRRPMSPCRSAADTTSAARSTRDSADELARMAAGMEELVGRFRF